MAIGRRAHLADRLAIAQHQFTAPEHGGGVIDGKLHDAPRRYALRLGGGQRLAADETAGLVERHGKAEPRLVRGDIRRQFTAPGAITLFQP